MVFTNDWLASLTVGVEVVVHDPRELGYRAVSIRTIDRITPSGRFVVGNCTFNSNGLERCSAGATWFRKHLEPVTQDVIDAIKRRNLRSLILTWSHAIDDKTDLAVLRKIWAIMKQALTRKVKDE